MFFIVTFNCTLTSNLLNVAKEERTPPYFFLYLSFPFLNSYSIFYLFGFSKHGSFV